MIVMSWVGIGVCMGTGRERDWTPLEEKIRRGVSVIWIGTVVVGWEGLELVVVVVGEVVEVRFRREGRLRLIMHIWCGAFGVFGGDETVDEFEIEVGIEFI